MVEVCALCVVYKSSGGTAARRRPRRNLETMIDWILGSSLESNVWRQGVEEREETHVEEHVGSEIGCYQAVGLSGKADIEEIAKTVP